MRSRRHAQTAPPSHPSLCRACARPFPRLGSPETRLHQSSQDSSSSAISNGILRIRHSLRDRLPLELGVATLRFRMQQVTVRVPASTSNLGPGFDCLGVALRIYNSVTLTSGRLPEIPHPEIVSQAAA